MKAENGIPYGAWPSPVSAELIARGTIRLSHPQWSDGILYWHESRPEEGGRGVLVRCHNGGEPEDLLPEPFSVRSRVHEYGGLGWTVAGSRLWFVNDADQEIYELSPGQRPRQITQEPRRRFAEPVYDAARHRLLCIAEQLHDDAEPVAELVAVDITGGAVTVLHSEHDF